MIRHRELLETGVGGANKRFVANLMAHDHTLNTSWLHCLRCVLVDWPLVWGLILLSPHWCNLRYAATRVTQMLVPAQTKVR